jgi:outer membrane protein assembly factor BamB
MLGRDETRNGVSPEQGAPVDWQVESRDPATGAVRKSRNIKWSAKLGQRSLGGPVVANGLVWVGTNNEQPRDPQVKDDASVLMCFRESDGQFLYQYVSPRLRGPNVTIENDWPSHAMGSTPLIDGDRLWFLSNRCEAICLNIAPLRKGTGTPTVLWKIDLRQQYGVVPNCCGMAGGYHPSFARAGRDGVSVVTTNGSVFGYPVPAPGAPSLICFQKDTGRLLWKDSTPGKDILDV